jgi:hypothetical protein
MWRFRSHRCLSPCPVNQSWSLPDRGLSQTRCQNRQFTHSLPLHRSPELGVFHHPGNLNRRTHRTSRARTVRSREALELRVSRSRCPKRSDRSASKSRSLNLAGFAQILPGPPPNWAKAGQNMTPPSVRLFASKEAITGNSREIR